MDLLGDVVSWFADGDNWSGRFGVPARLREHVWASVVSLVLACGVALPIGLLLGHLRRGGAVAVNISNMGRALPSLAVIVLAFQVWGRSWLPVYVALVVLAVPSILTNTYTGIADVDDDVRESARGMGLTGGQILWRIELPIGLPLIMAGIRTAAVTIVATATLAALIGLGGLGRFIVDGRAIGAAGDAELLAGALLVAALSIFTEVGLGAVQRSLVPKGLRSRTELPPSLAEGVRPVNVPQPEGFT